MAFDYLALMPLLPIIHAPDPCLKQVCDAVEKVNEDIRQLMDDMLETMYAAPGIGLAAPQVGVTKRVVVMDLAGKDETPQPRFYINPEIIWSSAETKPYEEGCLSIPDIYEEVVRPARVKARYLDYNGDTQEVEADGLFAVCLQHEIDHLNGVLFIDYLSKLKKKMILRKLEKAKRQARS